MLFKLIQSLKIIRPLLIPKCFKRAAIVQIFKKGDKSLLFNNHLVKIFDRVIGKQVTLFLTKRVYLNPCQHVTREGRSCISAILSVLMFTELCCSVDMIYLDFSKTFDEVAHGFFYTR